MNKIVENESVQQIVSLQKGKPFKYCIPRNGFALFKLAAFAVGIFPRILIAAKRSPLTNPRTFQAFSYNC